MQKFIGMSISIIAGAYVLSYDWKAWIAAMILGIGAIIYVGA